MRKVLLLALACLVWLVSWSVGTAKADEVVVKGGRLLAPGFFATIQGRLAALPTPAWLQEFGVSYVIQADGHQVYVSFKDRMLAELAPKWAGKLVHLTGTLALVDASRQEKEHNSAFLGKPKILVVHATTLERYDPNGKEELTVTAVGTLHPQVVEFTIASPPRLWEIAGGKQSLPFQILEKELLEQVVKLEGNEVVATGTLKNGAFVPKTITISL
jgi:hypothetical protein